MSWEGNQAWLALIGAVFGGAGLKGVEAWVTRSSNKDDSATQFRTELRDEVKTLRAEVSRAEKESDLWREKYYKLLEKFIEVRAKLSSMGVRDTTPTLDEILDETDLDVK